VLGQVDRHAVRPFELDLDVAALGHFIGSRVWAVHGTRLFDPCLCPSHALDFNAEVVQASVLGRALGRGEKGVRHLII